MTEVTVAEGREANGQFKKGVSGNPKGSRRNLINLQLRLEEAVRENIRPERIAKIIDKMCELAENGSVHAAKLILDKTIANAAPSSEEQGEAGKTVIFQIVNHTHAAKLAAGETSGETIDAEVQEVSSGQAAD
jgi:hypothetical protein